MIYLIYSEEPEMARRSALKMIRKNYPQRDETNFVSFNMSESTPDDVARECEMLALGVDKKAVLAENCAFLAKTGRGTAKGKKKDQKMDRLERYCLNPNEEVDLFLVVYSPAVDDSNPVVNAVNKKGKVLGVPVPPQAEWIAHAKRSWEALGCSSENGAAEELVARVGGDYGRFLEEIAKMANYANGEPVSVRAIKMMVAPHIEDNTFAMSNALISGKNAEAIRIYHDLKIHSIDEVRLINILANQFRFLDQVSFLDARGLGSEGIARQLNANSYRVDITLRSLRHVKRESIKAAQESLYLTEQATLKGAEPAQFAFERFLANFSLK